MLAHTSNNLVHAHFFGKSIQRTRFTLVTHVLVSSSRLLSSIIKALTKNSGKHLIEATCKNWSNKTVFYVLSKKSSNLPLAVWAEESKNGLRFEIGPSYDVVTTTSQCTSKGQSSCNLSLVRASAMFLSSRKSAWLP